MQGVVTKNTGSWFTVKTVAGQKKQCKIKGTFRLKGIRTTNPVAVGDIVEIEESDGTSVITKIKERKNYIIRKSSNLSKHAQIIASNLDLTALIATVARPKTYTTFIDRFLATSEAYNVPACIIINKMDIYNEKRLKFAAKLKSIYEQIGYPVFSISALEPETLADFKNFIKNKTTLISGNSGVGKSTIINQLVPNLNTRTNAISEYHKQGTHTTTFSEMFDLPDGGQIIDTPGIKGFGLIEMQDNEISSYFKEIFEISKHCKFNNCTHTHEPQCAVMDAVEKGIVSNSRYMSYLNILENNEEEKYR